MAGMRFLVFIILFAISVKTGFGSMKQSGSLGRIVRGHHATVGQFPYTARIWVDYIVDRQLCGAALIGTTWLLTAAHCFKNAVTIDVYLGSLFIDDAEAGFMVPASNIVVHPNFDRDNLLNDIALLKIPPTNLCEKIGIVPLPKIRPNYPSYANEIAIGSGWGDINDQHFLPDRLQWGRMKILENEECINSDITNDELCTAMNSFWATTCEGDSGGPLVLETTGELLGIASSIDDSAMCENGSPAFFTRVTSFLDWIKFVSGIFYT